MDSHPLLPTGRSRRKGKIRHPVNCGWAYDGPEPLIFRTCYDLVYARAYRRVYQEVATDLAARLGIDPPRFECFPVKEEPWDYDGPNEADVRQMLDCLTNELVRVHTKDALPDVGQELGLKNLLETLSDSSAESYRGPLTQLYEDLLQWIDQDLLEELTPDLIDDFEASMEMAGLRELEEKEKLLEVN